MMNLSLGHAQFGREATAEPKKSARLAEKRKLREEAGAGLSEDDYYFTPLTRTHRSRSTSVSPSSTTRDRLSPLPSSSSRATELRISLSSPDPVTSSVLLSDESKSTTLSSLLSNPVGIMLHAQEIEESVKQSLTDSLRKSEEEATMLLYINRLDSISLSLGPGLEYPLKPGTAPEKRVTLVCSNPGCENMKKYTCSSTKLPVCSLKCYKENLWRHSGAT